MHFLTELIESPSLKDPANKNKNIHRHFYRYSKGEFIGPALKITKTKAKITLKGSFEYEDLIQEIVARTITEDSVDTTGVLITGSDISDEITNLGLNWKLKKSSGKTQNYKTDITDKIDKRTILECIETFRATSYLLLSFNLGPNRKVTTKKRIPQPSKKKIEDDEIDKRIQFSTGIISNTENNTKLITDLAATDFKSDIPKQWKKIIITNNYKIEEIVLPKGINNSTLLRIMAIRKGKLFRLINIDGDLNEKQYSIVV